jgi:fatty-acyl-CoA synthase
MTRNFAQVLYQACQEVPERAALHLLYSLQPDQTFTYRSLFQKASHYARMLEQAAIQPGEVVILILQHGPDLVAAYWGAILRGAIPSIMPFLTEKLQPEHYRSALAALFEITTPAAAVTYADFLPEAQAAIQGTSVRTILIAETVASQEDSDLTWKSIQTETLAGLQRAPQEIVLLQHSSGTTGLQKGVALSHGAVFNQLDSYSKALKLAEEDVIVSWLPLYHDMGLIAGFILPILSRVPLVLMSPFDWVRAPYRLMQAISRYRGTLCWLPNFAYNFCAQKIRDRDLEGVDLTSLRAVINCSEPMQWNSHAMFWERFRTFGLQVQALATSYAMAENVFSVTQGGIDSPVIVDTIEALIYTTRQIAQPIAPMRAQSETFEAGAPAEESRGLKMLSAGQPIQNTSVRVVDVQGRDLPERHIGEIALKSNCMLSGYYHRPDLKEKAFLDGWYLTGDLGYLAEGEVFVTGRKKDLIIVGGKNIYPQDLERLANEVEGVYPGRAVAFGIYNEQAGTEDVVIIAETASEPDAADYAAQIERLAAEIRQRVTRGSDVALRHVYVAPRNWLIKTSSGKIARQANREKYLQETSPKE